MDRNHHYYESKYKIIYCIYVLDSASQSESFYQIDSEHLII